MKTIKLILISLCFSFVANICFSQTLCLDGYKYGTIYWQVSSDGIEWNDLVDSNDSVAYKLPGLPRGKFYRAKVEHESDCYFSKVYDVFEEKCISLVSVKLPSGTDVSSIRISFAPLKYNKRFAYGVTSDDSRIDTWSRLFQYFKGGWIDDITNYHPNMNRSKGAYAPRALTYTDGCGVKRIFSVNSANWYNIRQNYWSYPLDKEDPTQDWPYIVWDEQIQINDFDGGCTYHDVQDPQAAKGIYGGTVEMVKQGIRDADSIIKLQLGRSIMVMSEPNGNNTYTEASQEIPFIGMITREYNKLLGFDYINLASETIDWEKVKVGRYFNDSGDLPYLQNAFLKNIVTPSVNGVHMYGEFGIHGLYGNGTITSANISEAQKIRFFDWLCDTYGAGKETAADELWFATNDEVFQYKYLNKMTKYSYEIEGDYLKIWMEVPKIDNFYWYEYTLLLDGVDAGNVAEVISDDHVVGLSYGESEGKMMLNINFDETLLSRAEKYISLFESQLEKEGPTAQAKEYKRDAEYFVQRLKPQLQDDFIARLSADLAPRLFTMEINGGADTTKILNNDIRFHYENEPLEYRVGEELEKSVWKPFSEDVDIPYTTSAGKGMKVLYAQLRNGFGVSEIICDSIYFDDSMQCPNTDFDGKYIGIIAVKISSDTDISDIDLSFAPLKYNKKFAYSVTSDGSRIDTWNRLFQYFKGGWIDDATNYHQNMDRSTGVYAPRALTYTDGCGVTRIFPISSANWYNLRRQYWSYPMDRENPTNDWPYIVWDEQIQINDFDGTSTFHDVQDPEAAIDNIGGSVEMIRKGLFDANFRIKEKLGRGLMTLTEPNGDSKYTEAAKDLSFISLITRQKSLDLGFDYVNLADDNLNLEKFKVGRYFNDPGDLESFQNAFRINIVTPSVNGVRRYGELGFHGMYGSGTVNSSNIAQTNKIQFFDWLCDTYGAGSETATDELWMATNDEVLQYKYLNQVTKYSYTIENDSLKIRLIVPEVENFYWHEYTLLVDGVDPEIITDITTSENIIGASFGESDGKLMLNVNFDESLLIRAEKYTSLFEESLNVNGPTDLTREYQRDALYFVQRLKPELQESFISRLTSVNLHTALTAIEISGGKDTTRVLNNDIRLHYSGTPVEYCIGEDPDNLSWVPFTEQIQYTLSAGCGPKVLYAQLRNGFSESEIVSHTIYYDDTVLNPVSIVINSEAEGTESTEVEIVMTYEGIVSEYRISENPSFSTVDWITRVSDTIKYNIEDATIGEKVIYMQLKNQDEVADKVLSSSINLLPYTAVLSLSGERLWNKIEYHTLANGTLNINLIQTDLHTSYTSKQFVSKSGIMLPWFFELNSAYYPQTAESLVEGNNLTTGTYFLPDLTGDTGPYPDSYISKPWVLKTKGNEGKGRFIFTLPKGTYRFKFIMSVGANATVNSTQLSECFYRVDVGDVIGEPVNIGDGDFTGLNNIQYNAEIDEVIVEEETVGNVVLYMYNTGSSYTARPAINLIEIAKLK